MLFSAPLKVFLSYSHLDNDFLDPFRRHLKSLADDGILERAWTDRDITAGLDWDHEIHRNLETCHLFIALTSAAFNDSSYINGVEMKRALERHAAGQCRIIPVYLKPWKIPKRLDDHLQFVPADKQAVSTASNQDAVMLQVVQAVGRAAEEILGGKWPQRSPAPVPPIPPPDDPAGWIRWVMAVIVVVVLLVVGNVI